MRVLVVPDGDPHTKPRAIQYALQFAHGDYVVVYDAEGVPEPDRLRRALAAPMPVYWLAISYAAYLALLRLVTAPYYWEKAEHAAGHEAVSKLQVKNCAALRPMLWRTEK
jgi:hypothetical protein